MNPLTIRQATIDDAKLLTDLAYTTFWDAFAHHPKNAPDDLNYYMRQAFNQEQIAFELADEKNIFLIAEVDGDAAGYSKIIIDNIEPGITAERPSPASISGPRTCSFGKLSLRIGASGFRPISSLSFQVMIGPPSLNNADRMPYPSQP